MNALDITDMPKGHLHGHPYLDLRRITICDVHHDPSSSIEVNDGNRRRRIRGDGQVIVRERRDPTDSISETVILKIVLGEAIHTYPLNGILNRTTMLALHPIKSHPTFSISVQSNGGGRFRLWPHGRLCFDHRAPSQVFLIAQGILCCQMLLNGFSLLNFGDLIGHG
jgi:hypothetical protein